jgi:hypothetical protein
VASQLIAERMRDVSKQLRDLASLIRSADLGKVRVEHAGQRAVSLAGHLSDVARGLE